MSNTVGGVMLVSLFAFLAISVVLCIGGQLVLNRINYLLVNTEKFRIDESAEKHLRETLLNGSHGLYVMSMVLVVTFTLFAVATLLFTVRQIKDPALTFELYYAIVLYLVLGLPGMLYVIKGANKHLTSYGHKIDPFGSHSRIDDKS